MKFFILLAAVFALNSCNTMIGIGRDTKQCFNWTKGKVQGMGKGGGGDGYDSGAPVY